MPGLDIRSSPEQGLGAFAIDSIQKGSIVREYVGEIIDEREKESRAIRKECKYMMGYGVGGYIDAEYCGNAARFFNHSCDPNCSAEEWTVSGFYRIGIMALKAIQAGEEITFSYGPNYHFRTCMCSQCRNCFTKKRKRQAAPKQRTSGSKEIKTANTTQCMYY
ncbi:hypothetical protein PF005_g8594 [Phytophthora fragariae]|nr:hypothetical protein PF009_g8567 [Phytophthora fragariae]KAE9110343.1 hypothetical protein PF007_g11892 [Phytophthora fragariae]KAE9217586.1 hypothetical protein PF005_g8594 [Phytophthora fragariae]KAE9241852.1 hypothetical protein PF004_g6877 [Phytophthora fragariae]KAE9242198.1 hypothetical protein PF002_g8872 [Phytophthora fragariae]